jgi:hypothetical protein
VVAWPAVSASSLMRKASATRRARTLHSSAKSNVRRETVKKTRRQNTNCPYGNKNNQRNKKETLTVHRVGDHSLVHVHGARHAHVGVVPAHEHDGEVGGLRGFDSRVCHLSNERENRIHRVCTQNTRAVNLIARMKIKRNSPDRLIDSLHLATTSTALTPSSSLPAMDATAAAS